MGRHLGINTPWLNSAGARLTVFEVSGVRHLVAAEHLTAVVILFFSNIPKSSSFNSHAQSCQASIDSDTLKAEDAKYGSQAYDKKKPGKYLQLRIKNEKSPRERK